jgi:serine/threonine protein kinase
MGKAKDSKLDFTWTTGFMRGISHKSHIASGGYGEVHKVLSSKPERVADSKMKMRRRNTDEVFARKLIRQFGGVTREDIESEARAITKLCGPGMNKFMVEVLRHGFLPRTTSYYYIDMEYCAETLEDRIGVMAKNPLLSKAVAGNSDHVFSQFQLQADSVLSLSQLVPVMKIMHHIACGLTYIHEQGVVHRDLKPRNGTLS